jgi:hypothetical protein
MRETLEVIEFKAVASVRKDLIEGRLQIGVDEYPNGVGSYETFQSRPAVQAPPTFGSAYIVMLEGGRLVVADACDLDITDQTQPISTTR